MPNFFVCFNLVLSDWLYSNQVRMSGYEKYRTKFKNVILKRLNKFATNF